jgi:hypothetical protein
MATDATGTPTTNYSIPKFNTAVDSPSGLGSNAQMDAIDTVILTQVTTLNTSINTKPGLGIVIALGA